jgi:hypothetical protein
MYSEFSSVLGRSDDRCFLVPLSDDLDVFHFFEGSDNERFPSHAGGSRYTKDRSRQRKLLNVLVHPDPFPFCYVRAGCTV